MKNGRMPEARVPRLRIERLNEEMVRAYAAMGPAERLAAGFAATTFVRARLTAHLGGTRPDWSEHQVAEEVARRWIRDTR